MCIPEGGKPKQLERIKVMCKEDMGGIEVTKEIDDEISEEIVDIEDSSIHRNKQKDYSQYSLDGQQPYGKGPLVLAVVKAYIEKHPNITLKELQTVFPKYLQGGTGVVETYEYFKLKYADPKKRCFANNNDLINLKGEKIAVCSQWGISNINDFIEKARKLGFDIKRVD